MAMLGSLNDLRPVFVWSLVLVGIVLAAFAGVVWFRRRVMQPQDDASGGTGFSLSALREIHRKGQISTEEYEKARAKLLEAMENKRQEKIEDGR